MTIPVLRRGALVGHRYSVERLLGRGPFSSVYLGRDLMEGEGGVALKLLESMDSDHARLSKLQERFSVLARLRHPNLVRVVDFGVCEQANVPFVVEELVSGEDLLKVSARRDPGEVLRMLAALCRAVEYLHSQSIVHLCLKPDNVRLLAGAHEFDGLKLLDYGLRCFADSAGKPVSEKAMVYASPEVLLGHPATLRSDLYSLGALAYQLLARRLPFRDEDRGFLLQKHLQGTPDWRWIVRLEGGPAMARVIATLMQKDPERRPSSAGEVVRLFGVASEKRLGDSSCEERELYFADGGFVGRDLEMRRLRETAEEVLQRGEGRLLFVVGERGAGKTRLMEEFRIEAVLGGWRILEAACPPGEDRPYGPFRRILSKTEAFHCRVEEESGLFRFEDLPRAVGLKMEDTAPEAGRFRDLLTRELVRRLTDRPTLLLLHDFHWADDATAAILDYLAADIRAHRVFICVSLRSEEAAGEAIGRLVERVVKQGAAGKLELAPLSAEAVQSMVVGMTGGGARVAELLGLWVGRGSGGNPFFVEEMLKHCVDSGILRREAGHWMVEPAMLREVRLPSSVVGVVKQRLAGLSGTAREMAQWIAIFNRRVPLPHLQATSGLSATALERGRRELVERQVAYEVEREGEVGLKLRHALISEVLQEGLAEGLRRKMHRRIGEVLEPHLGESSHLQELAMHFTEGRAGEKAVRYALQAMRSCRVEYANEARLRFCEFLFGCRELLPRHVMAEVAASAAEASCALGHPSRAVQILREELRRCPRDPEIVGRLYAELAFSCQYLGDLDALEQAASKGLKIISNLTSETARITKAVLLHRLSFCSVVRSNPNRGLAQLKEASLLLEDLGQLENLGRIHAMRTALHIVAGDLRAAANSASESLACLSKTTSYNVLPAAHSHAGIVWTLLGRFNRGKQYLEAAVQLSDRERSVLLQAQAVGNLAENLCRSGYLPQAYLLADKGIRLAANSENQSIEYGALATSIEVNLGKGDYSTAMNVIDCLKTSEGQNLSFFSKAHVCYLNAWLAVETGRFEEARRALHDLMQLGSQEAPVYEENLADVLRARILHVNGKTVEALELLFRVDRTLRKLRWPYHTCIARLWIAEFLLDSGQAERAEKYVRSSIRLAAAMNAIHLSAHARFLSGRRFLADERSASESPIPGAPMPDHAVDACNRARTELELALKSARQSDSRELSWRVHAELSRLEARRLDNDLAAYHAGRALHALREISSALPSEVAASYLQRPDRRAASAECEARLRQSYSCGSTAWMESMEESQIRTLCRASAAINSTRDLHGLLEAVIDQLMEAIGVERVFVFLRQEKTGKLAPAIGRTLDRRTIDASGFANHGILETVGKGGSPFVTANARFDPRLSQGDCPHDPGRCTVFCAPLKVRGKMRGVLYADRCRPSEGLTDSTLDLFAAFSHMAAVAVDNAMAHQQLVEEKAELEQHLRHARDGYPELIGESEIMKALRQRIQTVAASPLDVLIWGESGTGKELVARALHRTGRRAKGSFVAIDCGALSETLAEGELFGYRRGAFTGAAENRPGLLEAAQGGILFLDEIANLPVRLQPKLLRVLQEREVRRIGEAVSRKLDIQVIAATNTDLNREILKGRFRNDLYHRLNAMEIHAPSLRDRQEDIPLLLDWFLERTAHRYGGPAKRFAPEALSLLEQYRFPGNVRELANTVESSYYSAPGRLIGVEHLPAVFRTANRARIISWDPDHRAKYLLRQMQQGRGTFQDLVKEPFVRHRLGTDVLRQLIILALKQTRGSYKEAFRLLKIPDRDYIIHMQFLKRHDCCPDFRPYRRDPEE